MSHAFIITPLAQRLEKLLLYAHIQTHTHTCIHTKRHMHTHTHICTHAHTHTHMHTHIHIHTHTYTCTHTHTQCIHSTHKGSHMHIYIHRLSLTHINVSGIDVIRVSILFLRKNHPEFIIYQKTTKPTIKVIYCYTCVIFTQQADFATWKTLCLQLFPWILMNTCNCSTNCHSCSCATSRVKGPMMVTTSCLQKDCVSVVVVFCSYSYTQFLFILAILLTFQPKCIRYRHSFQTRL